MHRNLILASFDIFAFRCFLSSSVIDFKWCAPKIYPCEHNSYKQVKTMFPTNRVQKDYAKEILEIMDIGGIFFCFVWLLILFILYTVIILPNLKFNLNEALCLFVFCILRTDNCNKYTSRYTGINIFSVDRRNTCTLRALSIYVRIPNPLSLRW